MLTDDDVAEYQRLIYTHFGKRISKQEAMAQGHGLLALIQELRKGGNLYDLPHNTTH